MTFTEEEIVKHIHIGVAVSLVETSLALLTEHATILDLELAKRVLAAIEKYGAARAQLVSPLARALPASDSRN